MTMRSLIAPTFAGRSAPSDRRRWYVFIRSSTPQHRQLLDIKSLLQRSPLGTLAENPLKKHCEVPGRVGAEHMSMMRVLAYFVGVSAAIQHWARQFYGATVTQLYSDAIRSSDSSAYPYAFCVATIVGNCGIA